MIKSLSVGAFPEINDSFYSCVFFFSYRISFLSSCPWSSSYKSILLEFFFFIINFLVHFGVSLFHFLFLIRRLPFQKRIMM